ncbi:glycoside hydrolase family 104 protein [Azotobacter chroococcum]|uniref:Glycoside hydrolase family 104 protein n=1 Tax=Azotobacter chroococcum TaxID=353 RepID=A0AAQ0C1E2_9GAMM|nr:glycoside hydrolase family 104 protein [Azotobacter chroococcum]QQE90281.1 glycoside hydrolase family 104 protein [Azotobacter chroococcum]
MARISSAVAGGVNVLSFLDLIAWSEGTSRSPITCDDGYDVIVTGSDGKPEIFTDYWQHPFAGGRKPKHVRGALYSSASGRYQHMRTHWPHYRDQLRLPDFGPLSQDRWAIQLIRERKALDDIKAGRIPEAIAKVRNLWASLPGAGYAQPEHDLEDLLSQFIAAGGVLA